MILVPDRLTPLPVEGLLSTLAEGYHVTMASECSAGWLSCAGAQGCLETGNGEKIHGNNPGNRKLPHDWDGEYAQFKCDELFDPATARVAQRLGPCVVSDWRGGPTKRVVLLPPHPWTSFVSFETAVEGFADYVALLARNYTRAWSCAYRGDADGFSRMLKIRGYYSAEVETYTRGLVSISHRIRPACERLCAGEEHGLSDEDRAHVASMVALSLADIARGIGVDQEAPTDPAPPDEVA